MSAIGTRCTRMSSLSSGDAAPAITPSARYVYVRLFCRAGFADSVISSDQVPPL